MHESIKKLDAEIEKTRQILSDYGVANNVVQASSAKMFNYNFMDVMVFGDKPIIDVEWQDVTPPEVRLIEMK